ncbi:MAG: two-component regulator propeller domain-containing protein [Acidobacteriota bacterium]
MHTRSHRLRHVVAAPLSAMALALLLAGLIAGSPLGAQSASLTIPHGIDDEPTPMRAFRIFDKRTAPGLPQSTVTAMHQDGSGRLWLATLDGLASYDGVAIEPIDNQPGAPTVGRINTLARKRGDGLYVGSQRAVFGFDGQRWRSVPAPRGVARLIEDAEGRLWRVDGIGGVTWLANGWSAANADAVNLWTVPPLPDDIGPVVDLRLDADGALHLADDARVLRLRDGAWQAIGGALPTSIGDLTRMLVARDGTVWIGTARGAVLYAAPGATSWRTIALPARFDARVRSMTEDRRGRIWVGSVAGRIAHGTASSDAWQVWGRAHGLPTASLLDILADREGSLWFSFNTRGLRQWFGEAWSHRHRWLDDPWGDPRVSVFGVRPTRDGRGFWASVLDRGLWHWDGARMRRYDARDGLDENVLGTIEPAPGQLWIGSRFGIYTGPTTGPFRRALSVPSGFVYGFRQAPDGTWYAMTSEFGAYRHEGPVDGGRWLPASFNAVLPSRGVRDLLWRDDGSLWAATLGGVVLMPRGTDAIEQVRVLSQHASNTLLDLDDQVWSGGFGGVGLWDREGQSLGALVEDDGLPGHTVYSLARGRDGVIWIGGASGIGRRTADGAITIYGVESGLIDAECNHDGLYVTDDAVYVGTMGSLARFDTRVAPLDAPPLRLRWQGDPERAARVDAQDVVQLPADQRSVQVRWSAPWTMPEPITYRVRVPRLDDAWSVPQTESVRTVEMRGRGLWAIEVQARRGDDPWTPSLTMQFQVAPYWWETGAARVGALAALIAGIALLIHGRTRKLAQRARQLEQTVEENLTQIRELGRLIPICAKCKKIRDDEGYWEGVESYLQRHAGATLSHGLCPSCYEEYMRELDESIAREVAVELDLAAPHLPADSSQARGRADGAEARRS